MPSSGQGVSRQQVIPGLTRDHHFWTPRKAFLGCVGVGDLGLVSGWVLRRTSGRHVSAKKLAKKTPKNNTKAALPARPMLVFRGGDAFRPPALFWQLFPNTGICEGVVSGLLLVRECAKIMPGCYFVQKNATKVYLYLFLLQNRCFLSIFK